MKKCRCHGLAMDRIVRASIPGWTCAEKRRVRQLDFYHRRKHDPDYQLTRQLRDMARTRIRY